MESHALPLSEPERPRLLPDRVRDADATEVVRERGATHERHGSCGESQAPGGGLGELGHARRVLAKPRRLETGERGDGREGGVDPLARDPDLRERLGLERLLPHPRLVQLGEEVVEVPHGEIGEPGVVRGARSTLDDGSCLVGARGREEEGDVPSPRAEDASAAGSRRRGRPGTPVRPSVRRRTRALPGRASRGRATRRTAAPPRTSSRTPHEPSGRRSRWPPRPSRRGPPEVGRRRCWPGRTRAPPRGWSGR